jgi:Sulfotransferase family
MTVESLPAKGAMPENSNASQAPNLAYILAVSYSGSTLLAMLLGSQPEATTVGEMRAPAVGEPDTYLCSCGEQIKKCHFWREVAERMAKRGIPDFDITKAQISIHDAENRYVRRLLDPMPRGPVLEAARRTALALSPAWPKHLQTMHRRNVALVEALQEVTSAKVVVDSSKIALHLKYLLKSPALRIKVIRLVRDGRAVANSMLGHGTKSMAEAALSWRRNNEAAERVLADMAKSQWMHLQYEELCKRPEETLRGICEFLGMDTRNIVLDFRARQQHVLGNEMRMKSSSEIRVDERWRTKLSKEDLATFAEVAGDLNRKYGYE